MDRSNNTFHDTQTERGIRRRVQAANAIAEALGAELADASLDAIASDIGNQIGPLDPRENGDRLTGRRIEVTDQSVETTVPVTVQAA